MYWKSIDGPASEYNEKELPFELFSMEDIFDADSVWKDQRVECTRDGLDKDKWWLVIHADVWSPKKGWRWNVHLTLNRARRFHDGDLSERQVTVMRSLVDKRAILEMMRDKTHYADKDCSARDGPTRLRHPMLIRSRLYDACGWVRGQLIRELNFVPGPRTGWHLAVDRFVEFDFSFDC